MDDFFLHQNTASIRKIRDEGENAEQIPCLEENFFNLFWFFVKNQAKSFEIPSRIFLAKLLQQNNRAS